MLTAFFFARLHNFVTEQSCRSKMPLFTQLFNESVLLLPDAQTSLHSRFTFSNCITLRNNETNRAHSLNVCALIVYDVQTSARGSISAN